MDQCPQVFLQSVRSVQFAICIGNEFELSCLIGSEILRSFAERISGVLDTLCGLIRLLPFTRPASFVLCLTPCLLPGFCTHIIQCALSPLDKVIEIKAALGLRNIFVHRLADPPCTIRCNAFDRSTLLFGKLFKELSEYFLAMPVVSPDHAVSVVINDDCDVFMTFAIACLIDTDMSEVIEPMFRKRIGIRFVAGNDRTDRIPCDTHIF